MLARISIILFSVFSVSFAAPEFKVIEWTQQEFIDAIYYYNGDIVTEQMLTDRDYPGWKVVKAWRNHGPKGTVYRALIVYPPAIDEIQNAIK